MVPKSQLVKKCSEISQIDLYSIFKNISLLKKKNKGHSRQEGVLQSITDVKRRFSFPLNVLTFG